MSVVWGSAAFQLTTDYWCTTCFVDKAIIFFLVAVRYVRIVSRHFTWNHKTWMTLMCFCGGRAWVASSLITYWLIPTLLHQFWTISCIVHLVMLHNVNPVFLGVLLARLVLNHVVVNTVVNTPERVFLIFLYFALSTLPLQFTLYAVGMLLSSLFLCFVPY